MAKGFDIYAGLRQTKTRKGKVGKKIQMRIKAPVRLFNPDDKQISMAMAMAVAEVIADNLTRGRSPDGAALPGLAGSTVRRRVIEGAQGSRGGEAHPRYKDQSFRARVAANYRKDYTPKSAKLKKRGSFVPHAGGPRGLVSGLLAGSVVARPTRDGKGFLVFVAAQRGKPRKGETESAFESALGGRKMWNSRASLQPAMEIARQKALKELSVVGRAALAKQIAKAARQLKATLGEISDFGS